MIQVGTIERDTLLGVPCCVYLPHAYYERATTEVFPVLYLHHGMYGSEDSWSVEGNLLHWMDSLLCVGAVREMIVVMPDNFLGSIPLAERNALINAPNVTPDGEQFSITNGAAHWRKIKSGQEREYEISGYWEKHFPEFMAEVEHRYSASCEPTQRAIAGLSMGGFHTMHVSHYLHGQFAYIGLFSALVVSPDDNEVYANWEKEVPLAISGSQLYWIGIGKDDFLYNQLQDYRHWLDSNNLQYTYYESSGGHTWDNWQDYICCFFKEIF